MTQIAAITESEIAAIRLGIMALFSTHPDPRALAQSFTSYVDRYAMHLESLGSAPESIEAIRSRAGSLMGYIRTTGA